MDGSFEVKEMDTVSTADICEALARILAGGVDVQRCAAAQALGKVGDPTGVEPLIKALLDEDEDVRTDAAESLGHIGDDRAAKQLLDNLIGDPCYEVKKNAIDALVKMKHAEVVPWLRRMIKGQDEEIVWDHEDLYHSEWDAWTDIQVKALESLAEMGVEEAVPEIIEALDDELGQDMTETAFRALASMGMVGIKAVGVYLFDKDERRRRRAAAVLCGSQSKKARALGAKALHDLSAEVRLAAARGLASRNECENSLGVLFVDEEPSVKAEALRLCGTSHPKRVSALLDDKMASVQKAALDVLAAHPELLPAQRLLDRVRERLAGGHEEIAASAAAALAAIAPEGGFDDLVEQVGDGERPLAVRMACVRALGALEGDEVSAVLRELAGDDERQVRLAALVALASNASRSADWPNPAGDTLMAALRRELVAEPESEAEEEKEEPEPEAAEQAKAQEEEVEEPQEDSFPTGTLDAVLAQNPVDGPVAPEPETVDFSETDLEFLELAQRNTKRFSKKRLAPNPDIPAHFDTPLLAARVLGDVVHGEIADALADALSDVDKDVRLAAIESLALLGQGIESFSSAVTDALLAQVTAPEREMRLAAMRALAGAGGVGAVGILIERLGDEDPFIRGDAVRGLARLGHAAVNVVPLLEDPDGAVRMAAAQAVAEAGGPDAANQLIGFAYAQEGLHRLEAGKLLARVDAGAAVSKLIETLNDDEQKRRWQVAVDMLGEFARGGLGGTSRLVA